MRIILFTFFLFSSLFAQGVLVFDDSIEQIQEHENEQRESVEMIIDDVHAHPSVIRMQDYKANSFQSREKKKIRITRQTNKFLSPRKKSQKIDFWQLLHEAMQKSAALILKKHDMKITEKNVDIVKSAYYPQLSLRYYNEYYHGFSRDGSTNIGGSVYPSESEYRNSLNLNMEYELYRFGAYDLQVALGEFDVEILRSEIALEKERIAKELLQNYTTALSAQEKIKTKKKMLAVKDGLLANTQRLFDSGFASQTDITRLRIDVVQVEKEILQAELTIVEAMKNIDILSNINIDTKTTYLEMLSPREMAIKSFGETALSENIRLKLAKKIREIELLQKEYLPTVSATGGYQLYGGDEEHIFEAISELQRNNWNVGITLSWDIFNGFKTDETIEREKLEIAKLVEQHRLEEIAFGAREEKRGLLKEMVDRVLAEESLLFSETSMQKDLLSRIQKSGNVSILEVDKVEVSRLQSELDFKLEVINQVHEDILAQLMM